VRGGLAALVAAAAAVLAAPAAAAVHVQTAAQGPWRARFSYDETRVGGIPRYQALHLTVTRGGTPVLDRAIHSQAGGPPSLQPGALTGSSISFHDLDANGTPELLLSLYTGGAHCCFVEQIFGFTPARPRTVEQNFGDPGMRLTTVDGQVLLRTADDSFAYAFTDFADSALPVQLLAYRDGRLVDVTRLHPTAVRADAARLWSAYLDAERQGRDVRGLLAAWAADQALLGHSAAAHTQLSRLAASGTLDVGAFGSKGMGYVRALWRFLARQGYLR
jgi:hypothetical protein